MADQSGFVAIVLAAGRGTRMKSDLPKTLHPLLGKPMVCYPVEAALAAGARHVVVVVGHGRELLEAELGARYPKRVGTSVQEEQRGTGDAARCGADAVEPFDGWLVILNGDIPLITADTIRALLARAASTDGPLCMLTSELADATGYGRILRDARGKVIGVREERDCTEQERRLTEWNPGAYAVRDVFFREAVSRLSGDNAQGELYLTDLVAMAAAAGGVGDLPCEAAELLGTNDRAELAEREHSLRLRMATELAQAGISVRDPANTFIDADVVIEPDVTIEPGVHLRGRCRIGRGTHVDVGCILRNVEVGPNVELLPYTVATDSSIGERARVGPFSHLRPASVLGPEVHMGNFVETKKTTMARGAKANHLAYLGDSVVGERANIGAGTIFCNYDGFMKHTTVIEEGVFVGSDSHMVAPVTVGKDAYVGTGTTVTMDVPPGGLAIGRARQVNKEGLGIRLRAKLKAQAEKAKARGK